MTRIRYSYSKVPPPRRGVGSPPKGGALGSVRAPEGRAPIGGKSPLKGGALGFAKMGPKRPSLGGGDFTVIEA